MRRLGGGEAPRRARPRDSRFGAFGIAALVREWSPSVTALATAGGAVAAGVLGLACQFRAISEWTRWEHRHDHLRRKT